MAERPDWKEAEAASAENISSVSEVAASTKEVNEDGESAVTPKTKSEGPQAGTDAVVFGVELPPSAYVTMFLREVTKQPNAVLSGLRH